MSQHVASNMLAVPLTITMRTSVASRNITREVSDIRFRSTVPGGFATCTVELNRAFTDYWPELAQFAILRVTDGRTGAIAWEGRLEDPGRTASESGQVWSLSALGPSTHPQDNIAPYVAIESSMASFVSAPGNPKWSNGSAQKVTDIREDDLFDGFKISLDGAADVRVGDFPYLLGSYMYPVLAQSGQQLAVISGSFVNGRLGDSNHKVRLAVALDETVSSPIVVAAGNEVAFNSQATTNSTPSGPSSQPYMAPNNFQFRRAVEWNVATGNEAVPVLQWIYRSNSAQTVGPQHWLGFGGPVFIRPVMHDRLGTPISATAAGFAYTFARSDQVFDDLMATRLPLFDPLTTTVDPGTDGLIVQFSYPDPASTEAMLSDLMALEGGLYYWAAWESYYGPWGGVYAWRARAEWKLWPAEVKHIIGMEDGADLPTSTEQVFDSVSVRWTDTAGRTRNTAVTRANPILDAAGIHRRGTADAGDNTVSDFASALDFGNKWLADHAYPRGSGTLTVARPVLDRQTGRMLAPWELRPGCLVQIKGADPSGYSQGATARNGRNVFRVIAVEFDSASGTARLELDAPAYSVIDEVDKANRNKISRRR